MWNRSFETTNSNNKQQKKPHWRMESSKHNNILSTQIRVHKPNIKKKIPYILNHRKKYIQTTSKKNKTKQNVRFISFHIGSLHRAPFVSSNYLPIFERSNSMMGTSYSTARRFWITKNLFILKNRMQYHVCISVIIIFNQTLRYFLNTLGK